MVGKNKTTIVTAVLMSAVMILSVGGTLAETKKSTGSTANGADSGATRIVYGTVDDVAGNLVKVNQDKTEGITPRYLDLSEVEKKDSLHKGDQVKMKVNLHNIVIDYWIIEK